MEDRLLDIREASKMLRLSIPTIYKLSCERKIPVVKLNSRLLFSEKRLEEWIREHFVELIPK